MIISWKDLGLGEGSLHQGELFTLFSLCMQVTIRQLHAWSDISFAAAFLFLTCQSFPRIHSVRHYPSQSYTSVLTYLTPSLNQYDRYDRITSKL